MGWIEDRAHAWSYTTDYLHPHIIHNSASKNKLILFQFNLKFFIIAFFYFSFFLCVCVSSVSMPLASTTARRISTAAITQDFLPVSTHSASIWDNNSEDFIQYQFALNAQILIHICVGISGCRLLELRQPPFGSHYRAPSSSLLFTVDASSVRSYRSVSPSHFISCTTVWLWHRRQVMRHIAIRGTSKKREK